MAGVIDLILEPRLGPRKTPRRQQVSAGSDVVAWLDVRDELTKALVPEVPGMAALYWLPGTSGDESAAQPLVPVEVSGGTWQAVVPQAVPGTYVVWWMAGGQAAKIVFDVSSRGELKLTSKGTVPWGDVQAVAAAAAVSAALVEVQRGIALYAGPVVAAAIAEAMAEIGAAAATAATAAVAQQLAGMATKASVEALTREVARKATIEALAELGRRLTDKADAAAADAKRVTDDLAERLDDLAQNGPGTPEVTALAIAKAFGAAVADFSDGRNAYRLFFV